VQEKTVGKAVVYMLISVVGFALMKLTVKYLKHLPATELVLFRSIISLFLSLVIIKRKGISPWGNNKLFLILRGVFGVTALTMFFYTLQHLPIGSAITIQYLSPIFTVIFASFFLKEKMKPIQWVFFLLAFSGIAMIKGFDPNITPKLLLMGIASAIFSGLAYNCIRKLKDTDDPVVVVLYFPLIATPVMLIFSLFEFTLPTGWDWLLLVLMGILTQIAQIYMTKAYQNAQMDKTAP
jgi:drug/metabolite transporter (DMT)-like permease